VKEKEKEEIKRLKNELAKRDWFVYKKIDDRRYSYTYSATSATSGKGIISGSVSNGKDVPLELAELRALKEFYSVMLKEEGERERRAIAINECHRKGAGWAWEDGKCIHKFEYKPLSPTHKPSALGPPPSA
jgi:hypothetical protein